MKSQQGQVLLITVMLLATAITVVLSLSFRSTTETQITKLQEENQKALAAAEAGIDASLKNGTGGDFNTINALSGLSGINMNSSNVFFNSTKLNYFTTPLLQKDEQYTFYLADYPGYANPFTNTLDIYYEQQSGNCNNDALEMTLIYGSSPYLIARLRSDTGNILNAVGGGNGTVLGSVKPLNNISFYCQAPPINIGSYPNPKIITIRFLSTNSGATTKLGFYAESGTLPLQGKTVTSTAQSDTGVTKTIQLFQSYPQIPADFFVTSF